MLQKRRLLVAGGRIVPPPRMVVAVVAAAAAAPQPLAGVLPKPKSEAGGRCCCCCCCAMDGHHQQGTVGLAQALPVLNGQHQGLGVPKVSDCHWHFVPQSGGPKTPSCSVAVAACLMPWFPLWVTYYSLLP